MVNKLYLVTYEVKIRVSLKNNMPDWWNNFWFSKPIESKLECSLYMWDCCDGILESTQKRLKELYEEDMNLYKAFSYGWANAFEVLDKKFDIKLVKPDNYPMMKKLKEDLTSYEYLSMIREFLNEKKS